MKMTKTISAILGLNKSLAELSTTLADSTLLRKTLKMKKVFTAHVEIFEQLRENYAKIAQEAEAAGLSMGEFEGRPFNVVAALLQGRCKDLPVDSVETKLYEITLSIQGHLDEKVELEFDQITIDELEKAKVPTKIAYNLGDLVVVE